MEAIERLLQSARPREEQAIACYNKPPSYRSYFDNQGPVSYFVHPDGPSPPAGSDEECQVKVHYTAWRAVKGSELLQVRYVSCDDAPFHGFRFSGLRAPVVAFA